MILDDLAAVSDSVADAETLGFLFERDAAEDGEVQSETIAPRPALFLDIYKKSGTNTVEVVDETIARGEAIAKSLADRPGAPALTVVRDGAKEIRLNVENVTTTIFLAILLTMLVVYLFMGNVRSTFITAFALPNSLLGAFILMYLMGFTINVMTLLALSLVVGLLVDDAIVVRENIFSKMEAGLPAKEAAQKGASEVAMAVVATSLTVIAVFLPMAFLSGTIGQFFKQFGLTVVFTIMISTFDGLTVAPMLSAYYSGKFVKAKSRLIATVERFQHSLESAYGKLIKFCLRYRAIVLAITTGIFALSLTSLGFVKQTFMPTADSGEFSVNLELPPGASLEKTRDETLRVTAELTKIPEIETMTVVIGGRQLEKNLASLTINLVPYGQRDVSTAQVRQQAREALTNFAGSRSSVNAGTDQSKSFQMLLRGDDLAAIHEYTKKILPLIAAVPDLVDVDSDGRLGRPEFRLRLQSAASEQTGVQPGMAGREIRLQLAGDRVGKLQEDGQEYDVTLQVREEQRDMARAFSQIMVPNVQNRMIPLSLIAKGLEVVGPAKIARQDRARVVTISGNLAPDGAIVSATDSVKRILAENPPPRGVKIDFSGDSEDMAELGASIAVAFGFGLLFIYLVLAALYESFVAPLTILVAIPPAMSGAFLALFVTGEMFNVFSMIGIIVLLGIVTKNSILLVDYAMKKIREGLSRDEAIYEAGIRRLRPILMTAISMIVGTLPIAIGLGKAAKARTSLGVVVIGGMLVSTFVTLIVVPVIFGWIDRLRVRAEKRFNEV